MRAKDLQVGDRVWIILPYHGGRGWATVKSLIHMGAIVNFDQDYNHIHRWKEREVSLRWIVKKESPVTPS